MPHVSFIFFGGSSRAFSLRNKESLQRPHYSPKSRVSCDAFLHGSPLILRKAPRSYKTQCVQGMGAFPFACEWFRNAWLS